MPGLIMRIDVAPIERFRAYHFLAGRLLLQIAVYNHLCERRSLVALPMRLVINRSRHSHWRPGFLSHAVCFSKKESAKSKRDDDCVLSIFVPHLSQPLSLTLVQ